MMDERSAIKEFFDSHQVRLSPVWLRDCIKWCKEEALPDNYSIKDLKYKVFEQWLLLDLRDVDVPCLPPGLSSKQKDVLNGCYSLQMMRAVDISKPKYWQIHKIRNEASKNLEHDETASTKRVLLLTLTDGEQEIEAMEYKPVPSLNLNLTPGIKIRLMGPVHIRRGRLMLESQNVKVIGGEVDTLMVSNAAENVLAMALKLPLNPSPKVIQESLLTANTDILDKAGVIRQGNIALNNLRNPPSALTNILQQQQPPNQIKNTTSAGNKINTVSSHNDDVDDFLQEEELRINEEIDMLMEIEREMEESTSATPSKPKCKTPDMFDDMEVDFENIDIPDTVIKKRKLSETEFVKNNSTSENVKTQQNPRPFTINNKSTGEDDDIFSGSLEADNDVFENINIDGHLDELDRKIDPQIHPNKRTKILDQKPPSIDDNFDMKVEEEPCKPRTPLLAIDKLRKNIPGINSGKFKIKAKFKLIVEKLTLIDDRFHLVVEVEDGSGSVTVKIHNDLVESWARCTAAQFNDLKSSIQENAAEAQAKALQTLKILKENLLKLDDVVEVHVNAMEKYPILLKIL